MNNDHTKMIDIIAPNLSGKGGTETVVSYLLNSKIIGKKYKFNILLTGKNSNIKWLNGKKNLNQIKCYRNNSSILKLIRSVLFYFNTKSDFILSTGPGQTYIAFLVKKLFKKNTN